MNAFELVALAKVLGPQVSPALRCRLENASIELFAALDPVQIEALSLGKVGDGADRAVAMADRVLAALAELRAAVSATGLVPAESVLGGN